MRFLRAILIIALIVLAHYALYAYVMYSNQLVLLFPGASEQHHAFGGALPRTARLVGVPASFGSVRAIYLAADGAAPAPALMFAHGNFDKAQDFIACFDALAHAGVAVLLLEYPGYDGADGAIGFDTLNEATQRAYDWLAAQPGVDAQRIVGMGYSAGGGVIAQLTAARKLRGLVLLSSYTSIADFARAYWLPAWLVRVPFDNVARLHDFAGPVLIVHGTRDTVIPFASGQALAHAARNVQLVELECGHADCNLDRNVFTQTLPLWLRANGILAPTP